MIYTITFNPALDYIVRLDHLKTGTINRTTQEYVLGGGKGINVSIVLNNLGMDTTALGFIAGFTGEEIVTQLNSFGVKEDFIRLREGLTRINVKVKASDEETEINGRGPIISDDELEALYKQLDALTEKDTLILAGSIPSSLPSDMYELIMERLQHKNIRIVVDATKDLLTRVLPYKPFLIKPNNHELSEIFGRPLSTKDDLIEAAKALQEKGAQHVLISMAGDGAILVAADGTVYTSPAPKGTLVNSVGAGDSMVAGFITGFEKTGNLQEALYWGISSGSASAYSENLATLAEVEALLSQVQVNQFYILFASRSTHMQITDLLKPQSVLLNADPVTKADAIYTLGELMEKGGNLIDKGEYLAAVFAREESGSTGLGDGIATPHAKSAGVKEAGLAAMVVPHGVDFEALDGQPSRLFFMIAAPEGAADTHVEVLSQLAMMVIDPDFKEALIAAPTVERFLELITAKEQGNFDPSVEGYIKQPESQETPSITDAIEAKATEAIEKVAPKISVDKPHYDVLAVTGCPTGIAHTYMAAESLERKAKEMGISLKVEKNGASGVKDALTAEEIAHAKCIIVASDRQVEMARFNGKPMIQTKVANGINKAEELLTEAMAGTAAVYQASAADREAAEIAASASDSVGRQIYKHLMNGVSHMLPFVIGGGILIALAFLFDIFDPANPKNFGSGTPLSAFLMQIGGASFGFMLPVLAGYIAMSIADRPGLVAGFVGGLLANQGGSGFLGALIAGFAAGYLVLLVKKLVSGLPQALEGTKPVLFYPVLGVLFIGLAITFVINPPVSALNHWLMDSLQSMGTTSRVLLGLIFGAMMSVDMGGPVNKAAYVIGTGALATGEYGIMAAVMAGGMVPPLAIALCTTFFPSRFTEAERKSGITNYIMGLSFITEGAIPFAAADPVRVLPACIIGAGTAGALSMFFECTLRAPHGGIFVVPTIGNPLLYLASIAIGSVVACFILALVKPSLKK